MIKKFTKSTSWSAVSTSRSTKGQSLVEFAFAIPVLLLFLCATIYFGQALMRQQVVAYAAQEGARFAAHVPNLRDPAVRNMVRGFYTNGAYSNYYSVIAGVLGSAQLLSFGDRGDLPRGAKVKILPWDAEAGDFADYTPPGTISVRIQYPFSLLMNPHTGQYPGDTRQMNISLSHIDTPANWIQFPDFSISQVATVSPEVYQY